MRSQLELNRNFTLRFGILCPNPYTSLLHDCIAHSRLVHACRFQSGILIFMSHSQPLILQVNKLQEGLSVANLGDRGLKGCGGRLLVLGLVAGTIVP